MENKKILLHYENNYVMVFYLSHGILLLPKDKKFLTLNPWSYIVRNGIGDTLQPLWDSSKVFSASSSNGNGGFRPCQTKTTLWSSQITKVLFVGSYKNVM